MPTEKPDTYEEWIKLSLEEIKTRIKEQMTQNAWKETFELLKKFVRRGKKRRMILQWSGQYKLTARAEQAGTQSRENIELSYRKILRAMLDFVEHLKEEDLVRE